MYTLSYIFSFFFRVVSEQKSEREVEEKSKPGAFFFLSFSKADSSAIGGPSVLLYFQLICFPSLPLSLLLLKLLRLF